MARPRSSEGIPPAHERIAAALWAALAEKPLREVTVAELCRRAGCNKTTFYYHFRDIEDLVDAVEAQYLETDFPAMLVDVIMGHREDERLVDELIERNRDLVDRARLLLGTGGDPGFAARMQEATLLRWYAVLGVGVDALDPYDALVLRHAMGGTSSVLAAEKDERLDYRLLFRVIADTIAPHIDRMLAQYGRGGCRPAVQRTPRPVAG